MSLLKLTKRKKKRKKKRNAVGDRMVNKTDVIQAACTKARTVNAEIYIKIHGIVDSLQIKQTLPKRHKPRHGLSLLKLINRNAF